MNVQIAESKMSVFYGEEVFEKLNAFILAGGYSQRMVIVDENTHESCLSYLLQECVALSDCEIVELPSGEENKVMDICMQVWQGWSDFFVDRKVLVVNLGGGVITDMGGFIAASYKRGVDFVNIPTTLIGQVDAALGGKVGVNLGHDKNMIGSFSWPQGVYIIDAFLNTLPNHHLVSGFAEMLKHGLIADEKHWQNSIEMIKSGALNKELIIDSLKIKKKIVSQDPYESGLRKVLNFGHTVGHAFETYFLSNVEIETPSHGACVAQGIIVEAYISHKINGLAIDALNEIVGVLNDIYIPFKFEAHEFSALMELMKKDKKNEDTKINMTLLSSIGEATFNHAISEDLIEEAFVFYETIQEI